MAARMARLGARGVVVDGRVRDLESMRQLALGGMSVWARGTSVVGAGAEAKFHAKNVPVRIGEAVVSPGDIVMIDPGENGVVAIPQEKLDEVLELLPKLVGADEKVIEDVERGVSVAEAFKWHRNL
jgi:regulator of RNase E activity RraA